MKRIYREKYGDGYMVAERDPAKERLLAFFASAGPVAVAAGYFRDEMTGEMLVGVDDLGYVGGGFSWSTRDVYHFERYDLALASDFRTYALESIKG